MATYRIARKLSVAPRVVEGFVGVEASTERPVIVKRLVPPWAKEGTLQGSHFAHLVQAARGLPGLPQWLEIGSGRGSVWMVEALHEGESLRQVVSLLAKEQHGFLAPNEGLAVVAAVAGVLARMHQAPVPVVHGDLCASTVLLEADGRIYVEAGVASPKLARFAANNNLGGAEFLAGVPGTFGGALAMNAGCYGGETWNLVDKVLTVSRKGVLTERAPEDFAIGYRHVGLKAACDEWFAAAWLKLPAADGEASKAQIKAWLDKRADTQPLALPNAGSVFRNPPGDHAARLIQEAGLKGFAIGGAQVSEKHANFIVNAAGLASAADIEAMIAHVQAAVKAKFGIELVREVRIVGEKREG